MSTGYEHRTRRTRFSELAVSDKKKHEGIAALARKNFGLSGAWNLLRGILDFSFFRIIVA
jgi:hypothetical protein